MENCLHIEEKIGDLLEKIEESIEDNLGSNKIPNLERKVNLLIKSLEEAISKIPQSNESLKAHKKKLLQFKKKKDNLIHRSNTAFITKNKMREEFGSEENDVLIGSLRGERNQEESQNMLANRLLNIKRLAVNTYQMSTNLATNLENDTPMLQNAIDKNDRIAADVAISDNYTRGIIRNIMVDRIYLVLVIIILGFIDVLLLYIKIFR